MGPELDNDCRRTGCMTLTEKYIRYVDTVKRYSPKTVRTYHDILNDFVTYAFNGSGPVSSGCSRGDTVIPDNEMMEILTPGMIRSYEVYLMDTRKVIPRTVNLHLSVLSGFCRFLIKEGLLTYNPVRTVARPKMPKRLPAVFRQASMAKYFRDTEIFVDVPPDISPEDFMAQYIASRPRGYREEADPVLSEMREMSTDAEKFSCWLYTRRLRRAIIAMLYCTGMRRAELVSLDVHDIDHDRMNIRVHGKGDKMREIPLTSSICKEISLYLQAVEMICGKNDREQALFVTSRGRRIYPEFVDRAVKSEFGESAGFTGKKSPHVLRHTLATELLDNGTDLYSIKELLGHSSLAATQVYTHNSIEKLKKVYQTAHPRAKNGGKNGD